MHHLAALHMRHPLNERQEVIVVVLKLHNVGWVTEYQHQLEHGVYPAVPR
jgi:hypothetical protein